MTIRDEWDAGSPQTPAGFSTWGQDISDAVDASVRLTGAQAVAGVKTFADSPAVPNPADAAPESAVSVGEVEDLIAAEPTLSGASVLHFGSLGPLGIFSPIASTAVETTLLTAVEALPALPEGSTFRIVAGGSLENTSGSARTFTFRLRVDGEEVAVADVSVANDTDGARGWRFAIDGESISAGAFLVTITSLTVAPGNSDPGLHDVAEGIVGGAAIGAGNWDLSVQMSSSASTIKTVVHVATITYSTP